MKVEIAIKDDGKKRYVLVDNKVEIEIPVVRFSKYRN